MAGLDHLLPPPVPTFDGNVWRGGVDTHGRQGGKNTNNTNNPPSNNNASNTNINNTNNTNITSTTNTTNTTTTANPNHTAEAFPSLLFTSCFLERKRPRRFYQILLHVFFRCPLPFLFSSIHFLLTYLSCSPSQVSFTHVARESSNSDVWPFWIFATAIP